MISSLYLQEIQELLPSLSKVYGANSISNPRFRRFIDQVMRVLGNKLGDALTRQDRELVEMGVAMIAEQGLIPGLTSGNQAYQSVLSALMANANSATGFGQNTHEELTNLTNLAYNTTSFISDLMYHSDGTMDYSITRGLDAQLVVDLTSKILHNQVKGKDSSQVYEQINLGRDSRTMGESIARAVSDGKIKANSEMHRRLIEQQREIETVELYSIAQFALNNKIGGAYTFTDEEGNKISRAEFSKMSSPDQRRVVQAYVDRLKDQGYIRENRDNGMLEMYHTPDTSKPSPIKQISPGPNGTQVERTMTLDEVVMIGAESPEIRNAVHNGTDILGMQITQTSLNSVLHQLRTGNRTENVLTEDVKDAVVNNLSRLTENAEFLSTALNIKDIDQLTQISEQTAIGDISDVTQVDRVKEQLQELQRQAIKYNKDIASLMEERAKLVEALAPSFGGSQFVNSRFVSYTHGLLNNEAVNRLNDSGTELRTQEELGAAIDKSYSNAESLFGGFAIGKYALENLSYLSEETRTQVHSLVAQGHQYLQEGKREEAHIISEQIKSIVNQASGGELSYYHVRQANKLYGFETYEDSVRSGLNLQVLDAYDRIIEDDHTGMFGKQPVTDQEKADRQANINTVRTVVSDIINDTGSDTSQVSYFMAAANKYAELYENDQQQAEEWLTKTFSSELSSKHYTQSDIQKTLTNIRTLASTGVDVSQLESLLTFAISNTNTIVQGQGSRRDEWGTTYSILNSKQSDPVANLSVVDQIVAGFYGDGSGTIDSGEAINIAYGRFVDDVMAGVASIPAPDRDRYKDENGNPVDLNAKDGSGRRWLEGDQGQRWLWDQFLKQASGQDARRDYQLKGLNEGENLRSVLFSAWDITEGGDFIHYNDETKTVQNEDVANYILQNKSVAQALGLTTDEKIDQFKTDVKQRGAQALQEYIKGSSFELMRTESGLYYLADSSQISRMSTYENKSIQRSASVDLSRFLYNDNNRKISSTEMASFLMELYPSAFDDTAVKKILASKDMLAAGDKLSQTLVDKSGGLFREGDTYESAKNRFLVTENSGIDKPTEEMMKVLINSQYGDGVYDKLKDENSAERARMMDAEGRFVYGKFKGYTLDDVNNQLQRGGLGEQVFRDVISYISNTEAKSGTTFEQILKDNNLLEEYVSQVKDEHGNVVGTEVTHRFNDTISVLQGMTIEEATNYLNSIGPDGRTRAEVMQSLVDAKNNDADGTPVDKIVKFVEGIKQNTDIIKNKIPGGGSGGGAGIPGGGNGGGNGGGAGGGN